MGNNVPLESNRRGYSNIMGLGNRKNLDARTGDRNGHNVFRKRPVFVDVIEESWQEKIVL